MFNCVVHVNNVRVYSGDVVKIYESETARKSLEMVMASRLIP